MLLITAPLRRRRVVCATTTIAMITFAQLLRAVAFNELQQPIHKSSLHTRTVYIHRRGDAALSRKCVAMYYDISYAHLNKRACSCASICTHKVCVQYYLQLTRAQPSSRRTRIPYPMKSLRQTTFTTTCSARTRAPRTHTKKITPHTQRERNILRNVFI